MTVSVAIYVFPEMELLDFAGPYEVLTTANRVHKRLASGTPDVFRVFTVARGLGLVRARAGLEIKPGFAFDTHPSMDLLIVPGGVVTGELKEPDVVRWIAAHGASGKLTASVCTGAFLLARAGLLAGRAATTHWEDIADLRVQFPDVRVEEGARWVDEGPVVSSAGISAGIDMSLHLVERLVSRELALATARQMDVCWNENN